MKRKRSAVSVISALVLVGASACSSANYGIAALNREASAEDQLPAVMADQLPNVVSNMDLDVESVRKVVESDGVSYYLGEKDSEEGFCVIYAPDEDWLGGCGEAFAGQLVSLFPGEEMDLPQVTLVEDEYSTQNLERDDWNRIHDNILIR